MKTSSIMLAAALAHMPLFADEATLSFNALSTVRNGDPAELFAKSAAEIVKFDRITKRMFVTNAATNSLDIFDATDVNAPSLIVSVDLSAFGGPNSVAVNPNPLADEVAVAVASFDKTQRGKVVFMNKSGVISGKPVTVGYLPDMLTYDSKGLFVVVANEGEPNDDYSFDPQGSVSIISVFGGKRAHSEVTFAHLTPEDVPGVRITGPQGTTVAQDMEPEFVAIHGLTAFVTCQENNAVAKIDLLKKQLLSVMPLGSINHADVGNAIDASDKDDMIRIANWPVRGLLMPDSIDTYTAPIGAGSKIRGTFFVTANEGDAREYGDYTDESRAEDLALDPSAFPLALELQKEENLGRLNVITTEGEVEGTDTYQQLFSYGTRSFSIFDENGEMVFDSGDMIETFIAENYPDHFNSTHDEGDSFENRSDNKGPEPEGLVIGTINGRKYVFVGLERFSGIFACDITNPRDVKFAGFAINRDFDVAYDEDNLDNVAAAGDLGPEGLEFVPAAQSPNGKPLLIVTNEVSGTTSIFEVGEIE